jgi:hypothetical protein
MFIGFNPKNRQGIYSTADWFCLDTGEELMNRTLGEETVWKLDPAPAPE